MSWKLLLLLNQVIETTILQVRTILGIRVLLHRMKSKYPNDIFQLSQAEPAEGWFLWLEAVT